MGSDPCRADEWFSFPDIKCESLKNGTKVEYTTGDTN